MTRNSHRGMAGGTENKERLIWGRAAVVLRLSATGFLAVSGSSPDGDPPGREEFLAWVYPRFGDKRAVPQCFLVIFQVGEDLLEKLGRESHSEPKFVEVDLGDTCDSG